MKQHLKEGHDRLAAGHGARQVADRLHHQSHIPCTAPPIARVTPSPLTSPAHRLSCAHKPLGDTEI